MLIIKELHKDSIFIGEGIEGKEAFSPTVSVDNEAGYSSCYFISDHNEYRFVANVKLREVEK